MAVLFQEEVHSHLSERQKQKQTLVRYWKNSRMITSERILKAFMEIPREYFVETSFADQAYADHPLPIGEGQTISQPCLLYTSPSPRDQRGSRMPSSA